jgi:hypothetical protein
VNWLLNDVPLPVMVSAPVSELSWSAAECGQKWERTFCAYWRSWIPSQARTPFY